MYKINKVYKRLSVNVYQNESGRICKVVKLKNVVHFNHKSNYYKVDYDIKYNLN